MYTVMRGKKNNLHIFESQYALTDYFLSLSRVEVDNLNNVAIINIAGITEFLA